ncbi:MAG TPA: hypothetical protein VMX18_00415 [Candidatus Bipolaricaulota bacterium]|nr:hypothetical protein [Candidatus Bipolaricaulota bacterium]
MKIKILVLFFDLLLTAAVCVNQYAAVNMIWHLISGLLFILLNLYLLYSLLGKTALRSWLWAALIMIGEIAILGSVVYFIYQLNDLAIALMSVFLGGHISALWLKFGAPLKRPSWPKLKLDFREFLCATSYLIAAGFAFKIIIDGRNDIAAPTPWAFIDKRIFIVYFIATFILIVFLTRVKLKKFWQKIFLSIHFFLSFSVAVIVYKLGFGYDPFIHQKTVELIVKDGFVSPKPFYYLGQYAIEVFANKVLAVPIDWLDRLLLPVLAAAALPHLILSCVKRIKPAAALLFLTVPCSFLIVTTPQYLSFLFCLIVSFLCFKYLKEKSISWLWPIFFAAAAICVHPLSGLPAFLFAIGILIFQKRSESIGIKALKIGYIILSATIAPLAFMAAGLLGGQRTILSFDLQAMVESAGHFFTHVFYWKNNFRYILDLVYFYGFNWKFFFLIFIAIFILFAIKKSAERKKETRVFSIYLGAFFLILINYLILKNIFAFNELIYYERSDYAQRLIFLMFIIMTPVFISAWNLLIDKIKEKRLAEISFQVMASLLICAGFYLSYPRFDNVSADPAVNVSKYDFAAAEYINKNESEKYVVLANQNTSAAAVRLYGFAPTLNGYFYYPVPTGGELYQYFLKMVNDAPKIEYVNEVKNLTGADTVYFVIPKYWNNFNNTVTQAIANSLESKSIDDQIYIFKY